MIDEQPIEQEHNDDRPGDEQNGDEQGTGPLSDVPAEEAPLLELSAEELHGLDLGASHLGRERSATEPHAAGAPNAEESALSNEDPLGVDAREIAPSSEPLGGAPEGVSPVSEDLLSQDLLSEDLLNEDLLGEDLMSEGDDPPYVLGDNEDADERGSSEAVSVVSTVDMETERAAEAAQCLDIEERAPQIFRAYLDSLVADTRGVLAAIARDEIPKQVRLRLIAGANYLRKSLDLIDEGVDGLGFLEDAFILRFCCSRARSLGALPEELMVLAREAAAIRAFLGDLSPRFEAFVQSLDGMVVRGRSAQSILDDVTQREEFVDELGDWAQRHKTPKFVFDAHGLVKLRSFLNAKLPR